MSQTSAKQVLAPIEADTPEQVALRFAEVREVFDAQVSHPMDLANWESMRVNWVGRKSGVLTAISENWLKPAKAHLKRSIGQSFNELKSHVEATLESRRVAIEDQQASSWASTQPNDEGNAAILKSRQR